MHPFTQPWVDRAFELRHVAGFHAGGVLPITVGTHRFGEKSGS